MKKKIVFMAMFLPACLGQAKAYQYDPNDFAVEVVSYTAGTGITKDPVDDIHYFNDPNTALGRPTVDTTGDGYDIDPDEIVPVAAVYQPLRAYEMVSVGTGGALVLKFNHPVANDINNPYGKDFIVFSNAAHKILCCANWQNGNPNSTTVNSDMIKDVGIVSVSQDGQNWHSFSEGPFVDDFAATLGRVYNPANPDPNLGGWNLWWGEATDPTIPLDPNVTAASLAGKTVAQAAELYGQSAGGTAFDIGQLGLDWIRYVKIEDNDGYPPEVDAVADVSGCGDYKHPFPGGDLNYDCRVDLVDLALLAANWLKCSWECE